MNSRFDAYRDDMALFGNDEEHGVNCGKVAHVGDGHLHGEDDDSPYDVDGCLYCGRCHKAL